MFRYDPRVSNHGDKTGIASPAGNDMQMHMFPQPSSCDLPEIYPDIEPFRHQRRLKTVKAKMRRLDEIEQNLIRKPTHVRNMVIGQHHKMAIAIGKRIHDDKCMRTSVQQQIFPVPVVMKLFTKDTG
jgi:hypothetical protein